MSIAVCRLSEIAPMSAKRVLIGETAVAVVRTAESVYAIDDRCSHADVSLSEGEVVDCTIECWLHGSAFDLVTGEPLSPPAVTAVRVFPVRLSEDDDDPTVSIDISFEGDPR